MRIKKGYLYQPPFKFNYNIFMKSEQYIIAIGASAGGMNQINTFFDFTPLDGVSYIVIQHLSADYKSMMASLLNKHSKLNIVEATNNMTVEANKVYLIPSKNVMTIKDGRLLLTDKLKGVNFTINTFFKSLAEERGDKAIGIILSGTGSDGTEGMEAIKEGGGLLITSDPQSSEYDQMPASAIATGLVDYIIPPEEMPKVIEHYVEKKMSGKYTKTDEEEEEEKNMVAITSLMKDKLPEDFSGYKKNTILRRIKRRAALFNLNDLDSYLDLLKHDIVELQNLAKDFLISVTSFFRDKDAFEVVEKSIIPELIRSKENEEIKMWVAGCATGEEAYSLAMQVREQLDAAQKNNTVKIFATDIDNEALQFAKKGCYSKSIEKDISAQRLERFFIWDNNCYRIKPFIREMLIFSHHDLVKNPPYCNMDFISCRNLLIYMNPALQKKVISMLHFGLKYKGYLFLGPSENIADISSSVEEIDKKWKIYKNTEAKRILNFETFIAPPVVEGKRLLKPQKGIDNQPKESSASGEDTTVSLLTELGYAGLTVNENNEVLSVFGDTADFLLQKMFVHHLPELLSKSLQVAYGTACIEADKTNTLTAVKGIHAEGTGTSVSLFVKPLTANEQGEVKRWVLFLKEDALIAGKQTMAFDENFYTNKYTVNIEEDLRVTKEKLASAEELLLASNENMQSFNEELLSANEEMQSTNEEMQSINEELQTINAEYHAKIKELSDLNDDLNNYFRSNVNGQIFVNKNLLLMKFSPGAATHINVLESDIGRPLSNISTNISFETIDEDIKEVLLNGGIIKREIQAINGKWYQVMTMPYLRKDNNQTDGAIITFNDISELKQIQEELAQSNKSLKAINADLDNFVYAASHDLLSPLNNIEHLIYFIKEKGTADAETTEYLNMLSTSVTKFREVIKEMATIGKIESEMLNVETIRLDEMIPEILSSIQSKISAENAKIETALAVKSISFSKKNCRSMFFNLINNAIKFKAPGRNPEIVISTHDLPGFTLLSVKDNGIGIPKNKIESIFKMYNRLNTEIEGQGLGLFLINKMIDASGGRVEVESEPGRGTEFKLFIKK